MLNSIPVVLGLSTRYRLIKEEGIAEIVLVDITKTIELFKEKPLFDPIIFEF